MSQRHRSTEAMVPLKQQVRAYAHSERHRIHVELQNVAYDVSAGLEPEDVHEPGEAWRPIGHRDSEVAKNKLANRNRMQRHWKTKMWKRRTQLRLDRANQIKLARQNSGLIGY